MPKIPQTLKDSRREAIIQAAVDCLEQHGLAGTSMRTIAEAVGLTKGGLYPYFENKEAILVAASNRYLEEQVARLEPREDVSAAEQLDEFLAGFLLAARDPRTAAAVSGMIDLWLSAGSVPEVRASIDARHHGYMDALAALVRRGQDEGIFRPDLDPQDVAGMVLSARDGMIFHLVKLHLPVRMEEISTLLRSFLLECLVVSGDGERRPRAKSPSSPA